MGEKEASDCQPFSSHCTLVLSPVFFTSCDVTSSFQETRLGSVTLVLCRTQESFLQKFSQLCSKLLWFT